MREDARLARPCPGDDEQRPLRLPDRLELGLVEAVEEALGARDSDPSMLAARFGLPTPQGWKSAAVSCSPGSSSTATARPQMNFGSEIASSSTSFFGSVVGVYISWRTRTTPGVPA